jgi:hypothetical protein
MGIRTTRMRKLGAVLALLLGSSVLVGAIATTAASGLSGGATGGPSGSATGSTGASGATGGLSGDPFDGNAYIKICKAWTATSIATVDNNNQGFWFKIKETDDVLDPYFVKVNAGACSLPLQVHAGKTYEITEVYEPWYQETAIKELDSLNAVTYDSSDLPGYTPAFVTVPAAGDEAAVQFTNAIVTGQTEICKSDVPNDTLSGTFSFDLTNTPYSEYQSGGLTYSIPVSVTIAQGGSACSPPVTVPAGPMEVTEGGTNLYVTSISANLSSPTGISLLLWDSTVAGESISWVPPSSPAEPVDVVSYTNATVGLEVCKTWDGEGGYGEPQGRATEFPFTEAVVSGVAGPDTAPGPFSIEADQCSLPTQYRAGTIVSVTEGPVPGTKVYDIDNSGALSTVPMTTDYGNRTTEVIVGAPVTGAPGSNTDEAWVTFTDGLAYPSTLKICKDAPAGSGPFSFTVSGPQYVSEYTSTGTVTTGWFPYEIADQTFTVTGVLPGECLFATPPTEPGDPAYQGYLPYNSTQLVTEMATSGFAASSIALTSLNTNVGVWTPSGFEITNEPALTNVTLGGTDTTSSADVTISEYPAETDVTWTNVDPPAAPTAPVTVSNPGGSNAGTTTAPTLPEAISVSKVVTALNANAHLRSELSKDTHQYLKLSKDLKAIETALRSSKLTKEQRAADMRLLAHLRAERQRLAFRIVRLSL